MTPALPPCRCAAHGCPPVSFGDCEACPQCDPRGRPRFDVSTDWQHLLLGWMGLMPIACIPLLIAIKCGYHIPHAVWRFYAVLHALTPHEPGQ